MSKKNSDELPRTKEELKELVKQTKKKFGINAPIDPNNPPDKLEIKKTPTQKLKKIVSQLNSLNPERVSKKIDEFLEKQKRQ